MSVIWSSYADRDEWLKFRDGIGASEAGSVCGYGFKTPMQLWREKMHVETPPDLSDNPRVQFGNDVEEPLRALYRVMYPQYQLDFEPYTILRRDDKHTFMFYTPDGWLTERETGRKGLYESKSSTLLSKQDYEKWNGQIPMGYYCQVLHGMYVGDFEFAELFAILLNKDNDATIRHYHFERSECEEDIAWLLDKETEFWRHVTDGSLPALPLTL